MQLRFPGSRESSAAARKLEWQDPLGKTIRVVTSFGSDMSQTIEPSFVRTFLLAWPIAFLAMKKWLQNFPYPVQISLSTFGLTSFLALLIALVTVGYQSVKAARANPVESLRYE